MSVSRIAGGGAGRVSSIKYRVLATSHEPCCRKYLIQPSAARHYLIPRAKRAQYLPISLLASAQLWTSSGPSAMRRVRMNAHIRARGVSSLTPAPP